MEVFFSGGLYFTYKCMILFVLNFVRFAYFEFLWGMVVGRILKMMMMILKNTCQLLT